MHVVFLTDGDSKLCGDISWEPHCIVNPFIEGPPTQRLEQNLSEFSRLSDRFNYLETVLDFHVYGLGIRGQMIQDIYIGHEGDAIYGITLENKTIKLLGGKDRVDLFEVYDRPDFALAEKYKGFYSNGKLNTRDCVGWYPITISTETLEDLRSKESDLGLYYTINRWVNCKVMPENISFGLSIDQMLSRLNSIIKWEKLLGACYHNIEQFTSVDEIPLIMNKVITGVEAPFAKHYLYLLNCILQKNDDIEMERLFLTIRYLIAHEIRRCKQE